MMVVDYLRSDCTAGLKLSVKTNEIDIYMNEKFNTCVAVERGRASERVDGVFSWFYKNWKNPKSLPLIKSHCVSVNFSIYHS